MRRQLPPAPVVSLADVCQRLDDCEAAESDRRPTFENLMAGTARPQITDGTEFVRGPASAVSVVAPEFVQTEAAGLSIALARVIADAHCVTVPAFAPHPDSRFDFRAVVPAFPLHPFEERS